MDPSPRRISTMLLIGTIMVSTAPVLIKLTPLEPAIMSAWRLLGCAAVMLPFAIATRHQLKLLTPRETKLMLVSGLLFGLHFLFFIAAFKFTSFESAVLLLAMQPILAAIMAGFILKERTTMGMWVSSAVAMVGMGILGWQDFLKDHAEGSWWNLLGDALVLLGGIVIVLAIIIGRRVRKKLDFPLYTAVVFGIGGLMNLGVAMALGEGLMPDAGGMGWLWLGLLVLLPTICGHNLFNYLVRHVRVFYLNLVILAEPVLSMLMRWIISENSTDIDVGVPEYTSASVTGSIILMVGVFVGLLIRDRSTQSEEDSDHEEPTIDAEVAAALPEV